MAPKGTTAEGWQNVKANNHNDRISGNQCLALEIT